MLLMSFLPHVSAQNFQSDHLPDPFPSTTPFQYCAGPNPYLNEDEDEQHNKKYQIRKYLLPWFGLVLTIVAGSYLI